MFNRKEIYDEIDDEEELSEREPSEMTNPEENRRSRLFKFCVTETIICTVTAIAFLHFFGLTIVYQSSMYPTFESGDCCLVSKGAYEDNAPKRGDVVIFKPQKEEKARTYYIKRVVAVPGDHIIIKDTKVYINDKLLDEDYLPEGTETDGNIEREIPEDCYFVMGDNRPVSLDSRSPDVGYVKREKIYGKPVLRLLPLTRMGIIN